MHLQGSASQGRYLLDLSCSLVPIDSEIGDDYQLLDFCPRDMDPTNVTRRMEHSRVRPNAERCIWHHYALVRRVELLYAQEQDPNLMVQRIARLCCQHQLLSSVSRQFRPF